MALDIRKLGGWGRGEQGDATNPTGQISSYAQVSAYTPTTITITNQMSGTLGFSAGTEVLIHVSTWKAGNGDHLGKIAIGRIKSVSGSVLTFEKELGWDMPYGALYLSEYGMQALTVPSYNALVIDDKTRKIAPIPYSVTTGCGGILALKARVLDLREGTLNVANLGIPSTGTKTPIPSETNEETSDFINSTHPILNKGDGIVICLAQKITMNENTRIGNALVGVPRTFGGDGGASVLIASESIEGFAVQSIATSGIASGGVGKGRCRICTTPAQAKNILVDEMRYALDLLHDPTRARKLGIRNFGDGRLGDVTNPAGQINTYARVTNISADKKTLTIGTIIEGLYDKIEEGVLVMVHVTGCIPTSEVNDYGRFYIRKIALTNGTTFVTFSDALPLTTDVSQKYICQLVTIPQFANLTLTDISLPVTPYNPATQTGGLIAIAVKGKMQMKKSRLNTEASVFPKALRPSGVNYQSNAITSERLMMGHGNGAVFLLVNSFSTDDISRIGSQGNPLGRGGVGIGTTGDGGAGYSGGTDDFMRSTGGTPEMSPGPKGTIGSELGTRGTILTQTWPYSPQPTESSGGQAGTTVCAFLKSGASDLVKAVNTGGKAGHAKVAINFIVAGMPFDWAGGSGGKPGSFYIGEVL